MNILTPQTVLTMRAPILEEQTQKLLTHIAEVLEQQERHPVAKFSESREHTEDQPMRRAFHFLVDFEVSTDVFEAARTLLMSAGWLNVEMEFVNSNLTFFTIYYNPPSVEAEASSKNILRAYSKFGEVSWSDKATIEEIAQELSRLVYAELNSPSKCLIGEGESRRREIKIEVHPLLSEEVEKELVGLLYRKDADRQWTRIEADREKWLSVGYKKKIYVRLYPTWL